MTLAVLHNPKNKKLRECLNSYHIGNKRIVLKLAFDKYTTSNAYYRKVINDINNDNNSIK